MKRVLATVLVVLAVVMLAACNSTADTGNSAGQEPAVAFPTGKFTDPDDRFAGFYYWDDGTHAFFEFGSIVIEGTYRVEGDILTDTVTDADEGGCAVPATYRWSYDGTNLKYVLVGEDNCEPRKATMDGSTWVFAGPAPER